MTFKKKKFLFLAADNQTTNAQQAELQTRILSILNKSNVGSGAANIEQLQPQPPPAAIPPHGESLYFNFSK